MDTETGWYYLQTRYYDPVVRRFINADNYELIPYLAGNIGELNLYSYCNNNPVMFTDATGTSIWNNFIKAIQKAGSWMAGGIQTAVDWVSGSLSDASYAIGDFFTQTVPDFFEYTVWDKWVIDKAWNTFMVGTIYQKGFVPAWNWTKNAGRSVGNWVVGNLDDILLWAGVVVGTIGVICLFIPGGQQLGAIMTVLGYGLTIMQVVRRYT